MRYEKGRKQETRERVIAAAASRFRKDGIEATGLASLMKDAGLTHGGFYAHFQSKDDLVVEAVLRALENLQTRLAEADPKGRSPLETLVDVYLSLGHRDHPERGCAVAAMGPELARHSEETRGKFTVQLLALLALIEERLPTEVPPETRRERAKVIFAAMAGCIQIARITPDPALSDSFLKSGRDVVMAIATAPFIPPPAAKRRSAAASVSTTKPARKGPPSSARAAGSRHSGK